jgi:hypothetical protein
MNATIEKLRKVREHDREVRRKYEIQPRQKLMPFRAWLRRKSALGEAVLDNGVVDSLMMWLPASADDTEKETSAAQLAKAVIQLAAEGDVTVTAISVTPA